jgi:hypothetical protein
MSSIERYKTLIPYLTGLYVSEDTNSRTTILRDGLLHLTESSDWSKIKADSERLLSVWSSKEGTGASEVVRQILDFIGEFTEEAPRLAIKEAAPPVIEHVQERAKPVLPFKSTPVFVEPDEEEEIEVEEEVEEEEEGMEVEVRTIRGKKYWYEAKTKKLYAIVGDDDVGEEVGILLANGTPVMIA